MRIAILHMTMGLVDRGAERAMHLIATGLSIKNQVYVIQSGPIVGKVKYKRKRVYPLSVAPSPAPTNLWEKIMFRLYLDLNSRQVVCFTRAATQVIQDLQPDLVIAVNGAQQLRLLRSFFPDLPIVVFGEAGIGYHDRQTLLAGPDLYIALTNIAAKWADHWCANNTRVVTIPNPVLFTHHKRTKISLDLPHPKVLVVGALTKYKNIEMVIEAIRYTTCSLAIIGDGERSDHVSQTLSSLSNQFRWVKHVEPDQMYDYYRAADLFCFVPDPQEAFGNVYIEAMAAGLPIVASDDPIRREIVGDKGIYVDPHDPQAIAKAIVDAYKLGKQNYQQELKKYALASVTSRLEKEFHGLV